MKLPDDFRDLLTGFIDSGVELVLIGGFAVAHHGHVRATKDIDVYVRPSTENAVKIMRGLLTFGAPVEALGLRESDFTHEGMIVQLGVPPLRIDLITSISGVDFVAATNGADHIDVDGRSVPVIGLDALLRNKRASARPQDLIDVARLEELHR